MAGILDGVTVVDLSGLFAGRYAAMVLADLGARVIDVEAVAGEGRRHLRSPFHSQSARHTCRATAGRSRWRWTSADADSLHWFARRARQRGQPAAHLEESSQ